MRLDRNSLNRIIQRVLDDEGTLRDLLAALAREADFVVTGDDFRQQIKAYGLEEAFLHILRDPQVLESIESVQAERDGERVLLEFRFSQSQTIHQKVPMGTAKVKLAPEVGLRIDDHGDAVLRYGDISVQWLFIKKEVNLQLRRVEQSGMEQDLLTVSAGDIFSRDVVLGSLRRLKDRAVDFADA